MNQGPRGKPPPLPAILPARPAGPPRQSARPAPSSEGILVNPQSPSEKLLGRLRPFLPASIRNTAFIDCNDSIIADGKPIGIREGDRLLVDYGPMFSHIPVPPAMRSVSRAGNMKMFLEITESDAMICAGDSLGQKKLYSRIG